MCPRATCNIEIVSKQDIIKLLWAPDAQEFRFHGVRMRGPCKTLQKAGASGKWTSNIQRDMLRKVNKADPSQARPLAKTQLFLN